MFRTWILAHVSWISVSFAMCADVQAGVFGTATLVKDPASGIPFEGAEAGLGAPWISYRLDVHTTAGEILGAIDFKLNGPLHQRWMDTNSDGVFEPTADSLDASGGDSHMLTPLGSFYGDGPSEDNSGKGSPLTDDVFSDYGVGAMLGGAWGISLAARGTSTTLAYIVIPKGTELQLELVAKIVGDELIDILDERDFFPVPEPSCAAQCCVLISMFAFVVRRR